MTLALLCTISHTLTAPLTEEEKQLRELKSGIKVAWKVLVSTTFNLAKVIHNNFTEY